ncbi:MAG: hypothetical protein JNK53_08235 [Phycisphaerae bacterium]|nr:hypothetical protein [Phycisphaerae bacterium]
MSYQIALATSCLAAVSLAHACLGDFVMYANYSPWLAHVNGPVVDPGILTAFDPANGSVQPVQGDMFAAQGLMMNSWPGLVARQYPASNNFYITTDTPGASVELVFTTPVLAAWVTSALNQVGTPSDHGYLVQFFSGNSLMGQSTVFGAVGAISTVPFDRVVIGAPLATDIVRFSGVYFAPIPGPGGVAMLLGGLALAPGRRRSLHAER